MEWDEDLSGYVRIGADSLPCCEPLRDGNEYQRLEK